MKVSATITLKRGKEQSPQRFHPWIFSGAIEEIKGEVEDGSWVAVHTSRKDLVGYGHYQNGSIAVRILSFGPVEPANDFWSTKISTAFQLRKRSGLPSLTTNAFRLVHGEGDGLPGLIIDFYDGVAVVQAHSAGMHKDRSNIASALKDVLGERLSAVYYKSQPTLPHSLKDAGTNEYLFGMGAVPHVVLEHTNKFYVDWEEGQKTGFFLDQRENRKLLTEYIQDKNVLNTFSYTGGFSIYALNGGASLVHSVDASQKAVEMTQRNIELNGFNPDVHKCFAEDTFDFLEERGGDYHVIVLDPPAFAKHRDAKHQAIKGYQRLNTEALRRIKSGGIIFTFSCSQVIDRQLFYDTIVSSAIQSKRDIKVLHRLTQPADHPVSIFHPEGEYLKGLVLYVV